MDQKYLELELIKSARRIIWLFHCKTNDARLGSAIISINRYIKDEDKNLSSKQSKTGGKDES